MGTSEKRKKKPLSSPSQATGSQDTYRAIFDNVNDAILLRDLKTMQILDVNSKLCEMTGYTVREIKRHAPGLV